MKIIDLSSLLSKLIKDYEKVYGMQTFEIKKINNFFVFTNINPNVSESFKNYNCNFVTGKTITDFPIGKESKEKLLSIFEMAWSGKETTNFDFFLNRDLLVVYSLKSIQKNGITDKLEGNCLVLDGNEFSDFTRLSTSPK